MGDGPSLALQGDARYLSPCSLYLLIGGAGCRWKEI